MVIKAKDELNVIFPCNLLQQIITKTDFQVNKTENLVRISISIILHKKKTKKFTTVN